MMASIQHLPIGRPSGYHRRHHRITRALTLAGMIVATSPLSPDVVARPSISGDLVRPLSFPALKGYACLRIWRTQLPGCDCQFKHAEDLAGCVGLLVLAEGGQVTLCQCLMRQAGGCVSDLSTAEARSRVYLPCENCVQHRERGVIDHD